MPEIKELLGKESLLAIKDYIDSTKSDVDHDLSLKEDKANKVTSLSDASTDTEYPSAKAVYDELQLKSNATNLENGSGTNSLQQKGNTASGNYSFAQGQNSIAYGYRSHAEGYGASYANAVTFGERVGTSTNPYTYAYTAIDYNVQVGSTLKVTISDQDYYLIVTNIDKTNKQIKFKASGFSAGTLPIASRVTGIASDTNSHSEGERTTASGTNSHAEGVSTIASGTNAHAEGCLTTASGKYSHAEGNSTIASEVNSHAEGYSTIAGYENQHVSGKYNDNKETTLFEVGNGTSSTRSNAFEVYLDGHAEVGLMGSTNNSVATKEYVDSKENLIETTWSNLKSLRDNSQLIPGRFYRITDYNCTTVQEDTSSAGHAFDIIIKADSNNKLNEKAYAIQHTGDTYFSYCKLAS